MNDAEILEWLLNQTADIEMEQSKPHSNTSPDYIRGKLDGLKMVKRLLEVYGDIEMESCQRQEAESGGEE